MIVFKTFFRLLKRNLHVVLIYTLIFLFISLMTVPKDKTPDEADVLDQAHWIRFQVIDEDKTPESQAFVDYLQNRYTRIDYSDDPEADEEAIVVGALQASVTIREGFVDKLARGETAVTFLLDNKNIESYRVRSAIEQYLRFAYAEITPEGTLDQAELNAILNTEADFIQAKRDVSVQDVQIYWFQTYFRFFGYIFLVIMMLMFSTLLMPFNSGGVKYRTLVSGFRQSKAQLQLIAGLVLLAIGVLGFFVAGSVVIGGKPVDTETFGKFILNAATFGIVSLAMSYLIVTLTSNRSAVSTMANVLPLGMAFLSGVMIPQEYIGGVTESLAKLFPMYYYVRGLEHLPSLWQNIGIQLLFAAVYILIALVFGRARKRESIAYDVIQEN